MGQDGLRGFLNKYEVDAMNVPVVDRFILKDIDTPKDYVWALNCLFPRPGFMIWPGTVPTMPLKGPEFFGRWDFPALPILP